MKHFASALIASALFLTAGSVLASTKLKADDYIAIQQLYAKYNHAIDSGDAAGWADTFTPDGVFNGRFKGREQLMAFIKLWRERLNGANRRHWNSNLVITPTKDGANGSVYLLLWDIGSKPVSVASSGKYEDELVKTKTGWLFKSRVVKGDVAAPAPSPNTGQ